MVLDKDMTPENAEWRRGGIYCRRKMDGVMPQTYDAALKKKVDLYGAVVLDVLVKHCMLSIAKMMRNTTQLHASLLAVLDVTSNLVI